MIVFVRVTFCSHYNWSQNHIVVSPEQHFALILHCELGLGPEGGVGVVAGERFPADIWTSTIPPGGGGPRPPRLSSCARLSKYYNILKIGLCTFVTRGGGWLVVSVSYKWEGMGSINLFRSKLEGVHKETLRETSIFAPYHSIMYKSLLSSVSTVSANRRPGTRGKA